MATHSSILSKEKMGRKVWWAIFHEVTESWTQLSMHWSMLARHEVYDVIVIQPLLLTSM